MTGRKKGRVAAAVAAVVMVALAGCGIALPEGKQAVAKPRPKPKVLNPSGAGAAGGFRVGPTTLVPGVATTLVTDTTVPPDQTSSTTAPRRGSNPGEEYCNRMSRVLEQGSLLSDMFEDADVDALKRQILAVRDALLSFSEVANDKVLDAALASIPTDPSQLDQFGPGDSQKLIDYFTPYTKSVWDSISRLTDGRVCQLAG